MGEADLPTSKVLEKQKILIDQLTHRLNLQLEDMNKLGFLLNSSFLVL